MKKLSILLLAAVMLFTCFALAACGGDEDTSSSATDTSSASSDDGKSNSTSVSEPSSETEETSEPEIGTTSDKPATSESENSEPETSEPDDDPVVNADPSPFWITHYNDPAPEAAGIILTGTDTVGEWSDHYAFKPIEGVENGYELVAFSYGTIADGDDTYNGHGEKLEMPEGGFVYATSIGNNWKTDEGQADGIDYVNDACNAQISRCRTWKVGDQFIIEGMDLDGQTIPKSSADDIMWYEDGYVCTATITPIV